MTPMYRSLRASYEKIFYLPVNPKIISAPVVTVMAGRSFSFVVSSQTPPQNIIYRLDDNLDVLASNNTVLFTLEKALLMAADRSVPIFLIESKAAARALASFCDENNLADGTVCTTFENRNILRIARRAAPFLRGMLDCRAESITEAGIYDLVGDTMENEATMLILPRDLCSADIIFKLKKRFIKVWGEVSDPVSATVAGIAGILTDDPAGLYRLYEKFPGNTLPGKIPLYAHKGYHITGEYPENSIAAVKGAAQHGFDAAEIDIKLTSDDKIVITHDKSTGKIYDGDLEVSKSTYGELSALRRKGFPDAGMDLFEPLMRVMKDYPETPVLIEIKPQEDTYGVEEIVRQLKKIAEDPECQPAFTCIMGYLPPYISYVHRKIPRLPVSHCTGGKTLPPETDGACAEMLYRFYTLTEGWNSAYNIYNQQVNRLFCEHCRLRGLTIFVWTYAFKPWEEVGASIEESYLSAIDGLTSDYVNKFARIPGLRPDMDVTGSLKDGIKLGAREVFRDGSDKYTEDVRPVIFEGIAEVREGRIYATEPGKIKLSLAREYRLEYGQTFSLVSEPVTLIFK